MSPAYNTPQWWRMHFDAVVKERDEARRERDAARGQLADLLEAAHLASASDDGWLKRLLERWARS